MNDSVINNSGTFSEFQKEKALQKQSFNFLVTGASGGLRTPDPRRVKAMLYP